LDQDRPLDIHFLGNKELLDELGKTHVNSAMVRYHMLDVEALGKSYGFADQIRTPFSDKHLVYQLLKNKSKNYYAPNKDIRYFQMRQINKALKVASLLFILTGFVWGGLNVLEGFTYRQQHITDAKKADFYNVRYEVAQERISALPVDPADLKVVVDTIGTLKTYKSEPDDMFRLISKSMDIFPEIQISKIHWVANINPNHKLGAGKLDSIINEGIQGVLGFSNISDGETGYLYYQIALISCDLDKFDGDYRKALNTIDQFAESLRRQDSVHDVSVVSLPLDISSEATLQGSTKEGSSKANFSVRIVLGIKDEA